MILENKIILSRSCKGSCFLTSVAVWILKNEISLNFYGDSLYFWAWGMFLVMCSAFTFCEFHFVHLDVLYQLLEEEGELLCKPLIWNC